MRCLFPFLACAVLLAAPIPAEVTFDWVTVGDPGNACDTQSQGCFGSVAQFFAPTALAASSGGRNFPGTRFFGAGFRVASPVPASVVPSVSPPPPRSSASRGWQCGGDGRARRLSSRLTVRAHLTPPRGGRGPGLGPRGAGFKPVPSGAV
jgi:hypothetical protein